MDNSNNEGNKKFSNIDLIMQGSESFTDNLCLTFRPFKCFSINEPVSNSLIVFLPTTSSMLFSPNLSEYVPIEQLEKYGQNSVKIFHYQPNFKGIESILYLFCHNLINEQWFNAYIFTDFNPPPN